jgi:glyoxylase-like metal-dependent hydrolase (beta-lactamase superfamily II)
VSRTLPDVERLGHGISVIPLPLPFSSPAWVNAYVLEGADGAVLIDCGVDWEPGHDRLMHGLAELSVDPAAIHTLIVSHLHPDHVGMAPRLMHDHGWRLLMHRSAAGNHVVYNDTPGLQRWMVGFGTGNGVPPAVLAPFADITRPDYMPHLRPPDIVVDDGDHIPLEAGRHLEVLHTPGHEHSHICLRDSRTGILFSGDHILPRITPVIMWDQTETDVLGMYLESVSRLVVMRIGLTYPAHGSIVERGGQRAEQILLHHERRLSGMEEIVERGPATAWQVMEGAYRPHLTSLEQRLALRETVSHLEHLRLFERLLRFDEDGIRWYRRS